MSRETARQSTGVVADNALLARCRNRIVGWKSWIIGVQSCKAWSKGVQMVLQSNPWQYERLNTKASFRQRCSTAVCTTRRTRSSGLGRFKLRHVNFFHLVTWIGKRRWFVHRSGTKMTAGSRSVWLCIGTNPARLCLEATWKHHTQSIIWCQSQTPQSSLSDLA